jgi:BA14K-like protein
MKCWLALFFVVIGSAAVAQTTGTATPGTAPTRPSANDDVPPGGCMPIGMTVSGEIVFPIQCKEFIERHRGTAADNTPDAAEPKSAAVEPKPPAAEPKQAVVEPNPAVAEPNPAAVEPKPARVEPKPPAVEEQKAAAVEQKPAAPQMEAVAPEKSQPVAKPAETVPSSKRAEHLPRERAASPSGCQHYRSYDPASGTYRSYDGQRRVCR